MATVHDNVSFGTWATRLWTLLFVLLAGCSSGVEVIDGGLVGAGKGDDLAFGDDDRRDDEEEENEETDSEYEEDDEEGGSSLVEYPTFRYTGNGAATCNGGTGPTQSGFNTSIDGSQMVLQTTRAYMQCGSIDKCKEDKANAEISQSVGTNTYTRATVDAMKALEESDSSFSWGNYAVFATAVDHKKANGNDPRQFSFSKPLPVFPFPAKAARFKPLEATKSWTATTSGSYTMTVTVTMQTISSSDTSITVKMITTIAEDRNRELYEVFPIPRESTYVIDPVARRITHVDVLNWFKGDKCDDRPEQVTMAYDVCEKISKRSGTENFRSCDQ